MCRVHPALCANSFCESVSSGSRTREIGQVGFDESAGADSCSAAARRARRRMCRVHPALCANSFCESVSSGSRTREIGQVGFDESAGADSCSAAARRARHRMCRVHPALCANSFCESVSSGSRTREIGQVGFDESAGADSCSAAARRARHRICRVHPALCVKFNGGPVGSLATIVCKPRQGRKAATVANDSGAGMRLAGPPPCLILRVTQSPDHVCFGDACAPPHPC